MRKLQNKNKTKDNKSEQKENRQTEKQQGQTVCTGGDEHIHVHVWISSLFDFVWMHMVSVHVCTSVYAQMLMHM